MKKLTFIFAAFITLLALPTTAQAQTAPDEPDLAEAKPVVYLTFDDGPSEYTFDFLRLLSEHSARGTFFVQGSEINDQNQWLLELMINNGHALGNHTVNHPRLTSLNYTGIQNELRAANVILQQRVDYTPTCYRPPFGSTNTTVRNAAASVGLTNSEWTANYPSGNGGGWDIDTNDWRFTYAGILNELNKIDGGEVVLMHDGGGDRSAGLAALRDWLVVNHDKYDFRELPGCGGGREPIPNYNDASSWYEFSIERLYRAYFLRPSDPGGFEYWRNVYLDDRNFINMSYAFAFSEEFRNRYGSTTNSEFVELVYNNVLERPSDPTGKAYWLNQMAGGLTRGEVMLYFSESVEFKNRMEPIITGSNYEDDAYIRYNT